MSSNVKVDITVLLEHKQELVGSSTPKRAPFSLVLRGTLTLGEGTPMVWKGSITHQSRRGEDFTPRGSVFAASNGFILQSVSCPDFRKDSRILFVRGSEEGLDDQTLYIPVEALPAVAGAIAEYNKQVIKEVI